MAKAEAKLPIIVECFERASLERFAQLSDLPLIYLMFWENPAVSYNVTEIATFAHGVGPSMNWLFEYKPTDNATHSAFIEEAHAVGLKVHPYTLQDDFLKFAGQPLDMIEILVNKGIDGIFTEFPHLAQQAFIAYPY